MNNSNCLKCNSTVIDGLYYLCDGCHGPICSDCNGLTASEIKCMQLKGKRALKFLCNSCVDGFQMLPVIVKRLGDIEDKLSGLLSKQNAQVAPTSPDNNLNMEAFIHEYKERELREKNLMVYNVPESKKQSLELKIEDDKVAVKNILSPITDISGGISKVIRIGKIGDKPRPIKIIFQDKSWVFRLLKNKNGIAEPNIKINADLTVLQRNHLNNLRAELRTRIENDEKVTIRYINNIPQIVPQKN
jgi:hypothetical protein